MKKVWFFALAAALAVAVAGCGSDVVTDSQGNVVSVTSSASSSPASQTASTTSQGEADYPNTLDGLIAYMKAQGYIEKDYVAPAMFGQTASSNSNVLQAQLIGAKSGKRYTGSYDGKDNITIELYEYDPANLDSTGEKVIDQVKQKGTFTIFEKDVEAYLSSNSKYLMVYKDTELADDKNDDKATDHKARQQKVIEDFQAFHA
ncbi:MAG TPA: hypothetical protein H9996_05175 [Candidatus Faecalibacterium avium]|nr:hypothetical protein [Candidatus Faecalibacterium avium]